MANEFIIKNGFHSKGDSEITGSLKVTEGISGSFSGSFQGDGSGLTGLPAGDNMATADLTLTGDRTHNFNSNDLIFKTGASNRFRIWNGAGNIDNSLSFWDDGSGNMKTSFYAWTLLAGNATKNALKVHSNGETSFGYDVRIGTDLSSPASNTKLHIHSNGSTNTTTALLVENSSNTELFKIDDDGTSTFAGTVSGSVFSGSFVGDGSGLTGVTGSTPNLQSVMDVGAAYTGSNNFSMESAKSSIIDQGFNLAIGHSNGTGDQSVTTMAGSSLWNLSSGTSGTAELVLDADASVKLNWKDGVTKSELLIDGTQMLVTDANNTKGLEYAADYSSNFTARSLVDKGYVDTQITSSATGSFTGSFVGDGSGLTGISGANFATTNLTLTGDRTHDLDGNTLQLLTDTSSELEIKKSGITGGLKMYQIAGGTSYINNGAATLLLGAGGNDNLSIKTNGTSQFNDDLKIGLGSIGGTGARLKVRGDSLTSGECIIFEDSGGREILRGSNDRQVYTRRLNVTGLGATSATTALLVENSSNTELFKIDDDGTTTITGTVSGSTFSGSFVGDGSGLTGLPAGDTYDLNATTDGSNVDINLTSTSGTDNSVVQLTAGSNITLTRNSANEVTIASSGGGGGDDPTVSTKIFVWFSTM